MNDRISGRALPYTTKTGIQIGIAYQPPLQKLTPEGEFIQSVLLGDDSVTAKRDVLMWIAYIFAVGAVFGLVAWSSL